MNVGLDFPPAPLKRWSSEDQAVLDHALETGRLPDPDNRIATQERLALYLGFSRQTIANHLGPGQRFPLCKALMSEGGKRSAYQRRIARVREIERHGAER